MRKSARGVSFATWKVILNQIEPARLLSEAEARRKDKPQELATKKMQAVTEETCELEPVTKADDFKID